MACSCIQHVIATRRIPPTMPRAHTNGIELEYDTFGSSADPAMLLIMGFRTQMIGWDEDLCAELAARGYYVIRFDNRDVGLSTKIEGRPLPNLAALFLGDHSSVVYTLEDMADDAIGLLNVLGIDAAHVVGASMGGMIAQLMAIRNPEKVSSLASIFSTTGDRSVGNPKPEALAAISSWPPELRESFIDYCVQVWQVIGSKGFPFDEERFRIRAGRAFDRSFYPAGAVRQAAAAWVAGDRTSSLASVNVPTVVIHGAGDPLVTPSGGEATARAIRGARLVMIPGMGHDLPREAWPTIIGALVENASQTSS
jgi:pimeloyl-ACP methyl ester carboxylesterase